MTAAYLAGMACLQREEDISNRPGFETVLGASAARIWGSIIGAALTSHAREARCL